MEGLLIIAVIIVPVTVALIGIVYIISMITDSKKAYKKGYIEAINDLYNKGVPKYILDKCANGEVRWTENYEKKTYEELQEGDL